MKDKKTREREVREMEERINESLDRMDWSKADPETLSTFLFMGRQLELYSTAYIKGEPLFP